MFKLYQQYIFPHLLDQVMKTPSLMQARRDLLIPIHGTCLEIGFGTGLNLSFYNNIEVLYALEPHAYVEKLAQERISHTPFIVEHLQAFAEDIPLADQSMQHIVSTWTMCSIADLNMALKEIHRLLSHDGIFHFVEHVLSDQTYIQSFQNLLTPLQKRLADGCHLNRNIEHYILDAGFEFIEKRYFEAKGLPRFGNRMLFARVRKVSDQS